MTVNPHAVAKVLGMLAALAGAIAAHQQSITSGYALLVTVVGLAVTTIAHAADKYSVSVAKKAPKVVPPSAPPA